MNKKVFYIVVNSNIDKRKTENSKERKSDGTKREYICLCRRGSLITSTDTLRSVFDSETLNEHMLHDPSYPMNVIEYLNYYVSELL